MRNKITSMTLQLSTEGQRINFTRSEVDDNGQIIRDNLKESYLVFDDEMEILADIEALKAWCLAKLEV